MKVKMNNITMYEVVQLINKFSFVTGRLGYNLNKTKSKIATEIKPFEEEREKLIRKYGKEDSNGNIVINQGDEEYQKFQEEMIPIANDTTDVEIFQVTKEEFDSVDIYNENLKQVDYEMLETLFVKKEYDDSDNIDQ